MSEDKVNKLSRLLREARQNEVDDLRNRCRNLEQQLADKDVELARLRAQIGAVTA